MRDRYPFHRCHPPKGFDRRLTPKQSRAIKELWRDYERKRMTIVRPRFVFALIIALVLLFLCSGCAAIAPVGMFPREQSTRVAEGSWLVLHSIDTAQTVQIARNPTCHREADPLAARIYGSEHPNESRVLLTNVLLAAVHSSVSRWLDDRVDAARLRDDDSVGPWYVGRIAWHTVSLLGTGASVINNYGRGLTPTSAGCP